MFDIAYGFSVDSRDDPLLDGFERLATAVVQSTLPTAFLVVSVVSLWLWAIWTVLNQNVFPMLKHFPSWFPGTEYRKWGEYWGRLGERLVDGAYGLAKKKIVRWFLETVPHRSISSIRRIMEVGLSLSYLKHCKLYPWKSVRSKMKRYSRQLRCRCIMVCSPPCSTSDLAVISDNLLV